MPLHDSQLGHCRFQPSCAQIDDCSSSSSSSSSSSMGPVGMMMMMMALPLPLVSACTDDAWSLFVIYVITTTSISTAWQRR
jgi:hypothetical protein